GHQDDPLLRRRHRGRRRGGERPRGGRPRPHPRRRRGAARPADAGHGRAERPGRTAPGRPPRPGADPDHVRRAAERPARPDRGERRVPAEGLGARGTHGRGTGRGGRRGVPVPGGDPARRGLAGVRRSGPARRTGPPAPGDTDRQGAGGPGPAGGGPVQRGRRSADPHERGDGQDVREPHPRQAAVREPRAGRPPRPGRGPGRLTDATRRVTAGGAGGGPGQWWAWNTAWPLPPPIIHLLTGVVTRNATTKPPSSADQNSPSERPASMAPGVRAMMPLSTSSITAMETVSAASATLTAALRDRPARSTAKRVRE